MHFITNGYTITSITLFVDQLVRSKATSSFNTLDADSFDILRFLSQRTQLNKLIWIYQTNTTLNIFLKTSGVYCSKRRDHTRLFSEPTLPNKRYSIHGCYTRKFTSMVNYLMLYIFYLLVYFHKNKRNPLKQMYSKPTDRLNCNGKIH